MILGDSFVWGNTKNEETYPIQLENIIGKEKVRVINAGISGYGTDQEYLFFKDYLLKEIKPDIVVWNINLNDISDNINRPALDIQNDRLVHYPQWKNGPYLNAILSQKMPEFIKKNSMLYNLMSNSLVKLRPNSEKYSTLLWSIDKIYHAVKEVEQLGKLHDFKLIVVYSPSQVIVENLKGKKDQAYLLKLLQTKLHDFQTIDENKLFLTRQDGDGVQAEGDIAGISSDMSLFINESASFPKGTWHPNRVGNLIMANSLTHLINELLQN